jgi:hypothetical protein
MSGRGDTLPPEMLDDRLAFVGTSGSGKTYAAKGMVEDLLTTGARVAIVDPLGVWWGLRSDVHGKPNGFKVMIFGGRHADLPLTEAAGAIIADAIAGGEFSAILDLSELPSQAARRRFMKAFAEKLYAKNNRPLHLVLDEADLWCPQRPMEDVAQLLGARIDEIVRRGRVRGFVPWLITQRPAVVHKDVLSQLDALVALKLTSSQDRDALKGWIEGQADAAETKRFRSVLPKLPTGKALVWWPSHEILVEHQFRRNTTFDSSRTPKRGEAPRGDVYLSPVSIAELQAKLAAVEAEAAENDPKELRERIRDLERQLRAKGDPTENGLNAARQEAFARGVEVEGHRWRQQLESLQLALKPVNDTLAALVRAADAAAQQYVHVEVSSRTGLKAQPTPPALESAIKDTIRRDSALREGGPQLRVLSVLAARHPVKMTEAQWATLSGMKRSGGTWNKYMRDLRAARYLEAEGKLLWCSNAGLAALGGRPAPLDHTEVIQQWLKAVGPASRMLQALIDRYPSRVSRQWLADHLQMSAGGGTFNKYLRSLISNGLVTSSDDGLHASHDLMR